MKLHSESIGDGPDVIFLHGLFGAGDNWKSIARGLQDDFRLHLIDLPNHGRSPWTEDPSLENLAESVFDWAESTGLDTFQLLGHSMGGKIAMQMALNNPDDIHQLVVVDIAPKYYAPHHQAIFKALNEVNFEEASDRKAVDAAMSDLVTDDGIRQFLLKSLHKKEGTLAWRFNVPVLESRYEAVAKAPSKQEAYEKPTLFIKGMNSNYITSEDQETILDHFPNAKAKIIEGAGHWPHAEKPVAFTRILKDFLTKELS